MLSGGFEPTTPVFQRAKTVHVLDRAATVIGGVRELPDLIIARDTVETFRAETIYSNKTTAHLKSLHFISVS
jgi:hypothetical protein